MSPTSTAASHERVVSATSGWVVLPVVLAGTGLGIGLVLRGVTLQSGASVGAGALLLGLALLACFGFFTLQPNQARVLVLFGAYRGTVRQGGFLWANPFHSNGADGGFGPRINAKGEIALGAAPRKHPRMKVSLRARNLNGERLKVNDKQGNPIEIAAVVVWRVVDTAQALFDVDDYEEYVRLQSETALRHLCSLYAYDHGEQFEVTLRSGVDEVSQALTAELSQRLGKAGVAVDEARLTHLAYAPEIAQAMLRRQQAEAVIAARQKIVQGAVSMVDLALRDLAERKVVELDADRKAAMVGNLLVVLCGEAESQPVINTGSTRP